MRRRLHLAAAGVLALATGCAGSGHFYGCDADAGQCDLQNADAGHPQLPPFLSNSVVVAHDEGQHDGFADVTSFGGQIYAAYRRAPSSGFDAHAALHIVRSADKGATWSETQTLTLPGFDPRDPKLTVFKGQLLLSFTAWDLADPTQNRAFFRSAASTDGSNFTLAEPSLPQPFGLSAWRPRLLGDALLLPVWTADDLFEHVSADHVSLLSSTDGLSFPLASALPMVAAAQPEVLVRGGSQLLVTTPQRQTATTPAQQSFCSSGAFSSGISAWTCWTSTTVVETPLLYTWQGTVLLFGRHDVGGGRKRTAIWQVKEATQDLQLIANLDTFGDTGAPGVLQLDDSTALLLYYTTSKSDPQAVALGHEATEVEAIAIGLTADVIAVTLSLPSAPIGN